MRNLLLKKAIVFVSYVIDHEEFEAVLRRREITPYIFYNVSKAFSFALKNKIDSIFFDFYLPASRNFAIRILKNLYFQKSKLYLLEMKADQLIQTRVKSINHYFELYNDFLVNEELIPDFGKDSIDYLSVRNKEFFDKDPGSWCYEVKTNSFFSGSLFNNIINDGLSKEEGFLHSFFNEKTITLYRDLLIFRIRCSINSGSSFVEEIHWGDRVYRVFGCCQHENGFVFILGSVREVNKLDGIGSRNGLKHGFISLVNHEFFTPLNIINGFSKLLLEKDYTKEVRDKYAKYIHESGAEIEQKLKRVYYLNMFYAGRLGVKKNWFNVGDLLSDIVHRFCSELKHDQSFVVGISDIDAKKSIWSNSDLLFLILVSLIENSIKFSQGDIHLDVSKNDKSDYYIFSVSDKGKGFPIYMKSHVFDMFTQINEVSTREHGGLGLGLHFSKCMVEFLGGEINTVTCDDGFVVKFSIPVSKTLITNVPKEAV